MSKEVANPKSHLIVTGLSIQVVTKTVVIEKMESQLRTYCITLYACGGVMIAYLIVTQEETDYNRTQGPKRWR